MNDETENRAKARRKKLTAVTLTGALAAGCVISSGVQQYVLLTFPSPYDLVPMMYLVLGPGLLVSAGMAGRGRAWGTYATLALSAPLTVICGIWLLICTFNFGFASLLNVLMPLGLLVSAITAALTLKDARDEQAWRERLYAAPTVDPVED